jgi:hypothetical protein
MKPTLHAAALPAMPPLTGEWLEEWLAAAKNLRPGMVRSYAAHIRLYYRPHIRHIRIDRPRVVDVASVFDAIDEINDAIIEGRASGDTALPATVRGRRVVGAPRHSELSPHSFGAVVQLGPRTASVMGQLATWDPPGLWLPVEVSHLGDVSRCPEPE